MIDDLRQNLKFALRLLVRDRGFTTTAVATLALCLAGNTAIFSIINSVILKPLPFPEPERIVRIGNEYPGLTAVRGYSGVPDYFDRLNETTAFEEISLHRILPMTVAGSPTAPAERLTGMQVTPSFFRVLRARSARGRFFLPEDGVVGQHRKAILGYGLWQRLFGGRDDAIGAEIRINAVPYTVVGTLPTGFQFVDPDVQLWTPAALTAADRADARRHSNNWEMLARLGPGATRAQAQSQIDALNARNAERYPQFKELIASSRFHTTVAGFQDELIASVKPILVLLWGGALVVLIIGCVNLANLVTVRATTRSRELATRVVLGASPTALARQILTESLVLAVVGAGVGLITGAWALKALAVLGIERIPRGHEIAVDVPTVLYILGLTTVIGSVVALVPIARVRHADLSQTMREDGRSVTAARGSRLVRRGLVTIQVAFALVLLACAGLLITSFVRVLALDLGFSPQQVLTGSVSLPTAQYTELTAATSALERILGRVRALPGVQAAGFASNVPFGDNYFEDILVPEEVEKAQSRPPSSAIQVVASDGYLEAIGLRLTRGRFVDARDTGDSPRVVVVDEDLAETFWPGADPVGKRVYLQSELKGAAVPPPDKWITVVGVVGATRLRGLDEERRTNSGAYYFAAPQFPGRNVTFAIRTAGDAASLATSARAAVMQENPQAPLFDVRTMDERLDRARIGRHASMILATTFAVVALFLVIIGLYGVMAFEVRQRAREIGIRLALGARVSTIFRMVLREGATVVLIGLVVGAAGLKALGTVLQAQLFATAAFDPIVLGIVALVVIVCAFGACVVPAREAARTDAVTVLANS